MTARSAVGSAFIEVAPRLASNFGRQIDRQIGPEVSKMSDRISSSMSRAGTGLTLGLTAPLIGAATVAAESLGRIETISAQTEAVIASTGGVANVSAAQIVGLADAIERTTSVESESVQEGQNMLLTFKNIRNEVGEGNDIFDQSTKALIDMSVAMGTEPSKAAIQLGKALNDPVKGISALSRVGITFTEDQKEMIASMVEAGDTMGAQKIILAELNSQFGGSAEALGNTMVGRIEIAKHAFGTMTETLTVALLPAVEAVTVAVQRAADWFNNLSPAGQRTVGVFVAVAAALGPVLLIGSKLITLGAGLVKAFGIVSKAFTALRLVMLANPFIAIAAAVVALVTVVVLNWDTIKEFLVKAWAEISRITKNVWGAITRFFSDTWTGIKDTAARVWGAIRQFFVDYWPIILGIMTGGVGLIVGLVVKNWDSIKATTERIWGAITGFLSGIWETIKGGVSGAWEAITGFISDAWDTITGRLERGIERVLGFFRDLPGDILSAFGDLGALLLNAGRDIISGLWDGLKDRWADVTGWLSDLGDQIAELKGPPSYDAKLLVDNGRLIFAGLLAGMRDGWGDVEDFLGSRTVAIDASPFGVVSTAGAMGGDAARSPLAGLVVNQYGTTSELVDALMARADLELRLAT